VVVQGDAVAEVRARLTGHYGIPDALIDAPAPKKKKK
jgi:hypothetical protein